MPSYRSLRTLLQGFQSFEGINLGYSVYLKRWAGAVRTISNKPHADDVIGIDLGTTNSRLAVMEGQVPIVIDSAIGLATPSFVAVSGEEKYLVGEIAKCHALADPSKMLFKMKNLIGKRFDDPEVQKLKSMVPYKIFEGSNGAALIEASNQQFSPTQVYAFILGEMKKSAEAYLKRPISKAVIAVPMYFSVPQRKETELAGKKAGLDVLGIIDEPIAAALSSGNGLIAVFDLGGGKFDVSILEISQGVIRVKARNGDSFLGGDEFDRALLEHLVEEIRSVHSVDVTADRVTIMRLREAAEKAKVELSYSTEAVICDIFGTELGPKSVKITITRSKFEDIVDHLVERIKFHCQNCLKDAGISVDEVDEVILVGGMTSVPRVQQIVQECFRKFPSTMMNPEEAVAVGATIQAGLIMTDQKRLLPGVTPLSLGIETLGGTFARIINRNSRIPIKGSRIFSTECDNQRSVCFRILQGEREMASDNMFLGELEFTGIPPVPQGMPRIELTFDIGINGILSVCAKHKGREQVARFQLTLGLDEEYVRGMVKEGILYGWRDKKKYTLARVRSMAAIMIGKVETILHNKPTIPEELHGRALSALADLRAAMESENPHMTVSRIVAAESVAEDALWWGVPDESSDDDF
uniref:Uncharacterized protein n=2 Tax=Davidia involucrata TaxID=16924 RepID=A0A5B6YH18_DAVIN